MRPLSLATPGEFSRVEGLIVDLDDTVLDHGLLSEQAYASLHRAARAGLPVLVATGRPAGWGEVLARQWPVIGVVTENGAVAFFREGRGVERVERASAADRADRAARLRLATDELLASFPWLRLADDNGLRRSDVTFDVGEREKLSPSQIDALAAGGKARGMRVTVSSVHLHLSLDGDDKASGALWFLARRHGLDPSRARARWAFAGDSGNDAACFSAFSLSFGVANVARYAPDLSRPPRYVAAGERGAGFCQIVEAILADRQLPQDGFTPTRTSSMFHDETV